MFEPVAEQECIVLIEVAVVEDQKELAAIRTESLNRVRNARSEVPEIAHPHVVDKVSSLRVDGRDPRGAIQHVGPFGGLVPMELTHAAAFRRMFTPAIFLEMPNSRTVTWRVQPPLSSRICASAIEKRRFGNVP